jgi:saccharopine dehydrogenase-like NADP-dependent oxidoreductase
MLKMKKVLIVGAGMMTRPIADYLMDVCNYGITMVDQEVSKAGKVIGGRSSGKAVSLMIKDSCDLDPIVGGADIVVSMLPRPLNIHVARSCLRCGKSMLTTSYETPEVKELADKARQKGILFLNEIGEDPGLDHFGTQMLLDEIGEEDGKAVDIKSYGCGLPAFEHNNNSMGYKFSWAPAGVFTAAKTGAAYYIKGKRIEVPGNRLFKHFRLVDIDGIGTFETYPNRDGKKYPELFGLSSDVSFYRGLLRYPGYCNNMRYLGEIGLFDSKQVENFENLTYRQLTASLVGSKPVKINRKTEEKVAEFLNLDINADFIHRLKWLGFFEDRPIDIKKGTRLDVLLDRMLKKMSYEPHEKDMIIVHVEIIAEFPDKPGERRSATMMMKGIPHGDSAMSRAVGLPVAIGARMVLEGKIDAVGAHIPPTLPGLYKPLLEELAKFGFTFKRKSIPCLRRSGGLFSRKPPP